MSGLEKGTRHFILAYSVEERLLVCFDLGLQFVYFSSKR